jgi:hypothetical protein
MPCIWGQHNNSQIFLDVGIIDALGLPAILPRTLPGMFKALIDTGAQSTMISNNVVAQLGLFAVGKTAIRGIGPLVTYHNSYLFHVAFVVAGVVHVLQVPVQGGEIGSTHGLDVLLGMDVIGVGSFKVEGNGGFSFSF